MKSPPTSAISSWAADAAAWSEERRSLPSGLFLFPLGGALLFQRLGRFLLVFLLSIHAFAHDSTPLVNWKKSPAALFVPVPPWTPPFGSTSGRPNALLRVCRTSASFPLAKSVVFASCAASGCKFRRLNEVN